MTRLLLALALLVVVGCEQKGNPVTEPMRTVVPFTYIIARDGGKRWRCIVDELKPLDTFRLGGTNEIVAKFDGECFSYTREPQ